VPFSPTFWTLFDVLDWLRLARSFWLYGAAFYVARGRAVRRNGRCRFLDIDVPILSALLVRAEADLAWALARHAARLAGIGVDHIVRVERAGPTNRLALWVREGVYLKSLMTFEAMAEKMAARIRALNDPLRPVIAHPTTGRIRAAGASIDRLAPPAGGPAGFGAPGFAAACRQRGPPLRPSLPIAA
jgi:hypothetical protein